MKVQKLASHLAKIEGKKRPVTIGNMREILSVISEVFAQEVDFPDNIKTYTELLKNGKRRLRNKGKK